MKFVKLFKASSIEQLEQITNAWVSACHSVLRSGEVISINEVAGVLVLTYQYTAPHNETIESLLSKQSTFQQPPTRIIPQQPLVIQNTGLNPNPNSM